MSSASPPMWSCPLFLELRVLTVTLRSRQAKAEVLKCPEYFGQCAARSHGSTSRRILAAWKVRETAAGDGQQASRPGLQLKLPRFQYPPDRMFNCQSKPHNGEKSIPVYSACPCCDAVT